MTESNPMNESANDDRITPDDPASMERWATEFDVTAEQLNEAIAAVGDKAADVEMHLKGTRSSTNADRMAAAEAETEPTSSPSDEATPGTPGTGENVCPACGGSGTVGGRPCDDCSGTGKVTVGVGGA